MKIELWAGTLDEVRGDQVEYVEVPEGAFVPENEGEAAVARIHGEHGEERIVMVSLGGERVLFLRIGE